MKVKFKNKDVDVKKLVQGAVVLDCYDGEVPNIYHLHRFACFNAVNNSVDLIVVDDFGKWEKNSADLTWPI
jgi:hypothetical protein